MSIKLNEILKLNHFEHAKVLTDIPLQGEFPVEAISVQEYPAEAFVRNNEFILTTCMSCDEMDIFVHFIEGLCRLNVTAVAIAMGCYIEEIPREIIGIAERNNLVMITIPWEVAFSNIVEDVFNLLKLEKNLELEKYRLLKDRLISMFLERKDLKEALNFIEDTVSVPCGIFDNKKNLITKSNGFLKDDEGLQIFSYKVNHSDIVYGQLSLDLKDRDLTQLERIEFDKIIKYNVISPILLWFERDQVIHEMELHHKEKFILSLVEQKDRDRDKVIAEGKSYGFDLDKSFIALVAKVDFNGYLDDESEIIKTLKDMAIRIAKAEDRDCLVAYSNSFLIIFLEDIKESLEHEKSYIKKFVITMDNLYPNLTFVWGIGGSYEDCNTIYYSYMDAIMSLKSGLQYGTDTINTMNTTLEYQVFTELAKNKSIMKIVDKVLEDLSQDNSMDLLLTLNEYYLNNRNISKTAEKIYLHRQSLNYRLKKIESLTGLTLDDPRESFLLELCIKMYHFNQLRKL
ncbi:MAG: hypothetical protein GX666_11435 [Tissierellia bacterium]|nr:hypothetical protein [Tissierellia bacterium]